MYASLIVLIKKKPSINTVFLGIQDVCSNLYTLQEILNEAGYKTYSYVRTDFFFDAPYNHTWQYPQRWIFNFIPADIQRFFINFFVLIKVLPRFHKFIFLWNTYFLPFGLDLVVLKIIGKDVTTMFCGDDARYRPIQWEINKEILGEGIWYPFEGTEKLFFHKLINQYLIRVFNIRLLGHGEFLTFLQKPGHYFTHMLESFYSKSPNPLPLIIHAPSNMKDKDTQFVLGSINILKRKIGNSFSFQIIHNQTNKFVLESLKMADILIDQRKICIARLSAEGLANSCVVINSRKKWQKFFRGEYVGSSPCIDYPETQEGLVDTLINIINDKNLRANIMDRSYDFARKNYSKKVFAKRMIDILEDRVEPNLYPRKNQKELLLKHSKSLLQYIIIYLFYKQFKRA